MFEKRTRILSIIRPLPCKLELVAAQSETAARRGELKRENFHFNLIARWFSDFVSNQIHCALGGINSGKRSAHSARQTPSAKKYSSSPSRSADCRSCSRKKSKW